MGSQERALNCLHIVPFSQLFFRMSIWSITTTAVERYANIAWKMMRIGGRRSLSDLGWSSSQYGWCPPSQPPSRYHDTLTVCTIQICEDALPLSRKNVKRGMITLNATMQYFLPLSIITFCYQRIRKRVSERLGLFQNETENESQVKDPSLMMNTKAILQQTRRTQRILRPLVILFALTMLPLNVFNLVAAFWDKFFYQEYAPLLISAFFFYLCEFCGRPACLLHGQ